MNAETRVDALDGLRGLAAMWVLLGHAAILTGFRMPILSEPDLGVDLFIMLSGFLMVYQFERRAEKEPWEQPLTWMKFWARRFFRIAPLYYILLIVALLAGPIIYDSRVALDLARHAHVQEAQRYLDLSASNVAMHASFLFGLSPAYAFRTPLPDWSIGLEMQFYAVFPFLMLLIRRTGPLAGAMLIGLASTAIVAAMWAAGVHFIMPAFLPLKMPIFLCGMLIACMAKAPNRATVAMLLLLALAFSVLPLSDQKFGKISVRPFIVLGFASLIYVQSLPSIAQRILSLPATLFSSKPLFMLGELSFGAYLIHLLLMQPVGAWLLDMGMDDWRGSIRFAALAVTTLIPTYALAALAYRFVEKPGQAMGRSVVKSIDRIAGRHFQSA